MTRIARRASDGGRGAGLRLISVAFPDVRSDDHAIVAESRLLYTLYSSLQKLSARET